MLFSHVSILLNSRGSLSCFKETLTCRDVAPHLPNAEVRVVSGFSVCRAAQKVLTGPVCVPEQQTLRGGGDGVP